jgi:septal ring factor EnvC (AmiA/AmiB activator)
MLSKLQIYLKKPQIIANFSLNKNKLRQCTSESSQVTSELSQVTNELSQVTNELTQITSELT